MKLDLSQIPNVPGVYLWKDKYQNILYIGKAKKLKTRMTQYFRGMNNSYKTQALVNQISSFSYIITNNEKEALILERNLIDEHFPIYNIKLTDDKRFPYIKLKLTKTLEISQVYKLSKRQENAMYFGPFPSGYGAKKLTNLLQRLTTYENGLPSRNNNLEFWSYKYEYAKKLLSSNNNFLIQELKAKMKKASQNMQFEIAEDIKKTLDALNYYKDNQSVEIHEKNNIDVIAFIESDGYLSISMFFYRMGILLSKKDRVIEITESRSESIRQFISQYYDINIKPEYIICNQNIETDIKVIIPKKGIKKQIINSAIKNSSNNLSLKLKEFIRKTELRMGSLNKLCKILKIKKLSRIVMMDNSNTNNSLPVSVFISYVNGLKKKSEYRKFNVEVSNRKADVDYLKQGIQKYFASSKIPKIDLFIVDGSKAQISEAKKYLPKKMFIIGLAKDQNHNTKKIVKDNGEEIDLDDIILKHFLSGMQIEVDRFAKQSHIRRRTKTFEGVLLEIKGIGTKIEKKLLNHFNSYVGIYNASNKELEKIVSVKIAKKIKEKLNESISYIG